MARLACPLVLPRASPSSSSSSDTSGRCSTSSSSSNTPRSSQPPLNWTTACVGQSAQSQSCSEERSLRCRPPRGWNSTGGAARALALAADGSRREDMLKLVLSCFIEQDDADVYSAYTDIIIRCIRVHSSIPVLVLVQVITVSPVTGLVRELSQSRHVSKKVAMSAT